MYSPAVKRRLAKVREKPLTYAQIRAVKEVDRVRDWQRLARGEVTPEQLQKKNSAIKNASEFRIVNEKAVIRYFRKRRLARQRTSVK